MKKEKKYKLKFSLFTSPTPPSFRTRASRINAKSILETNFIENKEMVLHVKENGEFKRRINKLEIERNLKKKKNKAKQSSGTL